MRERRGVERGNEEERDGERERDKEKERHVDSEIAVQCLLPHVLVASIVYYLYNPTQTTSQHSIMRSLTTGPLDHLTNSIL